MKSAKIDANVKKTLLRNCEQKPKNSKVIYQTESESSLPASEKNSKQSHNDNTLNDPSLCSSEIFFNYLNDVKKTLPSHATVNTKMLETNCNSKVTKKLNFPFNNRIYKNLIELNTSVDKVKNKKEKLRPSSSTSRVKKDMEPNIDDFYEDQEELDSLPRIPVIKPKFKPVRPIANGSLHKLVASFENL